MNMKIGTVFVGMGLLDFLLLLGVVGSVETDAMTVDETSRYRNEPAEDETEDNPNGEN